MKRVLREQRIGAEDPLGPLGLYATSLRPVPVPHPRARRARRVAGALRDAARRRPRLRRALPREGRGRPAHPAHAARASSPLDAYLMAMAREREWGALRPRRARAAARSGDAPRRATARSSRSSCRRSRRRWRSRARSPPRARRGEAQETPGRRARPIPRAIAGAARSARRSRRRRSSVVTTEDIQVAWLERRERAGSAERHIREITLRGEVALETAGSRVGVVNGLSRLQRGRRRVRAADAHHGGRRHRARGHRRRRARGAARRERSTPRASRSCAATSRACSGRSGR